MTAVSNAGPLIHLSKIGLLHLLREIFGEIVIPKEAWVEVVEKGLERGDPDALIVKEAGWLKVEEDPEGADELAERAGMHRGEACAILLARSAGVPILLDDAGARRFAEGLGLTVVGSLGVVVRAVRLGLITPEEGLEALGRLASTMRVSVDVYERARKAIERMRGT